MDRGAQLGNRNAKKGAEWRQALKRALAHEGGGTSYRDGLDKIATAYVKAAISGEPWALKDIGDRFDGKPGQAVEISGPDGSAIPVSLNYIPVCQKPDK